MASSWKSYLNLTHYYFTLFHCLITMLQRESLVNVIDNTWALQAKVIGMIGTMEKEVGIGDIVTVSIQKSSPTSTLRPGQVSKALIVRTKKEMKRADGTYIRFGDNAVIILDIDTKWAMKPKGKRVFWPVPKELRTHYKEVTNIAQEVI